MLTLIFQQRNYDSCQVDKWVSQVITYISRRLHCKLFSSNSSSTQRKDINAKTWPWTLRCYNMRVFVCVWPYIKTTCWLLVIMGTVTATQLHTQQAEIHCVLWHLSMMACIHFFHRLDLMLWLMSVQYLMFLLCDISCTTTHNFLRDTVH